MENPPLHKTRVWLRFAEAQPVQLFLPWAENHPAELGECKVGSPSLIAAVIRAGLADQILALFVFTVTPKGQRFLRAVFPGAWSTSH